ncbi:MAG TPA: nucleoside hydrolase [Acidobacteriota bacterium]|nr:nucleoside hydrolase [Acidobacteriota bacterium]
MLTRARALTLLLFLALSFQVACREEAVSEPIPIILDTDIGSDIDDTWALALLLARPEFELKLVVTDYGDTRERARLAARFLEASGYAHVPIGIGMPTEGTPVFQKEWVGDYRLEDYPGDVFEDGVQAMIDTILGNPEPVRLLVIGPAPNIHEALRREPAIARKAFVYSMGGSIKRGYDSSSEPSAEYNVQRAPEAASAMYSAGWPVWLAPLDTAGTIQLQGERYQRLLAATSPGLQALIANYGAWSDSADWVDFDSETESSILFDTLAVALILHPEFCAVEELKLVVSHDGFTRVAPHGSPVRVATEWQNYDQFLDWLVDSLLIF